jgi:hypothetical protein
MEDLQAHDDVVSRIRDGFAPVRFRPDAPPPKHPHRGARAAGVVSTVTTMALVAFAVTGGGLDSPFSRTRPAWSATPIEVSDAERAEIVEACAQPNTWPWVLLSGPKIMDELRSGVGWRRAAKDWPGDGSHAIEGEPVELPPLRLLDFRGGDAAVAIFAADGGGYPVLCPLRRAGGAWSAEMRDSGVATVMGDGDGGVVLPSSEAPVRPAGWIEEGGVPGLQSGASGELGADGELPDSITLTAPLPGFSVWWGAVDAEVERLVVDTGDLDVRASVGGGYFAVYWPVAMAGVDDPVRALDRDGQVIWEETFGEVVHQRASETTSEP